MPVSPKEGDSATIIIAVQHQLHENLRKKPLYWIFLPSTVCFSCNYCE